MNKRHLTISALALILMSACTDATGVTIDDLAGDWTASSIVFTSTEDAELVSGNQVEAGAILTLVLGPTGSYTFAFTFPQEENEDETGTYTVDGSTLTITPDPEAHPEGDVEEFIIERDGDSMTLTAPDFYEFDDLHPEEPSEMVITLTR